MKAPLFLGTLVSISLLVACATEEPALRSVGMADPVLDAKATSIEESLQFDTTDGQTVTVEPGTYRVVADGDAAVRLTHVSGASRDPIVLPASVTAHQERIATHECMVVPGEEDHVRHLVLLSPDGAGLEAIGYTGGVRTRGGPTRLSKSRLSSLRRQSATKSLAKLARTPRPSRTSTATGAKTTSLAFGVAVPTLVEIEGVVAAPLIVVSGPGFEIERHKSYHPNGRPAYSPGYTKEHPFVFEASGSALTELKNYFDTYLANPGHFGPRSASIVIRDVAQVEQCRWNCYEFVPAGKYRPGQDGRTRFTMICNMRPDNIRGWQLVEDDFPVVAEGHGSNNTAADQRVEIAGVTDPGFYPTVVEDKRNQTVTLTYDAREGRGILPWVRNIIKGVVDRRSMSAINEKDGNEISRRNFYETFPIRYEQIAGFDLHHKAVFRVVLSYDFAEDV